MNYLKKRLPSLGKRVELINDIQSGITIVANGSLLAWSIENLIRNGIDAIDRKDGKVKVSLRDESNTIVIQIQDNGKGIPKKDWKNIFRPGFSTKKSGWGLGLSLCQRIINEVVGGKVVKENETGEAKKFRQEIVASVKRTRKVAKEKGIKNTVIQFTPEF